MEKKYKRVELGELENFKGTVSNFFDFILGEIKKLEINGFRNIEIKYDGDDYGLLTFSGERLETDWEQQHRLKQEQKENIRRIKKEASERKKLEMLLKKYPDVVK